MKKAYNCDANVICPFYKSETQGRILCCLLPESTKRIKSGDGLYGVGFQSPGDKKAYKKKYCKGYNFATCPLAEVFMRKVDK